MNDEMEDEPIRLPTRADRNAPWRGRRSEIHLSAEEILEWRLAPAPTPRFRLAPCVFEGGCLRIGGRRAIVIRPWDAPGVTTTGDVSPARQREVVDKVMRWLSPRSGVEMLQRALPLSGHAMRDVEVEQALGEFEHSVPAEVFNLLCEYLDSRWTMLRFLAVGHEAVELASSNKALAFIMAHHRNGHDVGSTGWRLEVRRLLAMRRRDALARMGFEGSNRVEKLLRKVFAADLRREVLTLLAPALKEPRILHSFSKLPEIIEPALEMLRYREVARHLSPIYWRGLERQARIIYGECMEVWCRHAAGIRLRAPGHDLEHLRTVGSFHGLMRWYERRHDRFQRALRIPPPPFPGNDDIQPIATTADMLREGDEQDNCCGRLILAAVQRRAAYYRVLRPERATLELSYEPSDADMAAWTQYDESLDDPDGVALPPVPHFSLMPKVWRVSQLNAHNNSKAGEETWAAVNLWLAKAKESVAKSLIARVDHFEESPGELQLR